MATVFIGLASLFFLGHALSWVFLKTKIPDLLILVFLGYLLGPILGVVDATDLGKVGAIVSTVALIVILYEGGLNLSTKDLLKGSLPAAGMSFLGFFLIVLAAIPLALAFGAPNFLMALLVGLGISSTSSAIVIPMVKSLSISSDTKTVLTLESAFTDVLAIVVFLAMVDAAKSGNYEAADILLGLGSQPIVSVLFGIASGVIWALVKKHFSHILKMSFAGEAWALLTYGIVEASGMNGALGVLALGFTLANLNLMPAFLKNQLSSTPVTNSEMLLLGQITFLLRTFFFIYLGLLIQFSGPKIVILAIILSVMILATRYLSVRLMFKAKSLNRLDAMITTAMGPRGLACAVLATVPLQQGLVGGEFVQEVVFAVVPLTIFLTAVFVAIFENPQLRPKIDKWFRRYPENLEPSPSLTPATAAAPAKD